MTVRLTIRAMMLTSTTVVLLLSACTQTMDRDAGQSQAAATDAAAGSASPPPPPAPPAPAPMMMPAPAIDQTSRERGTVSHIVPPMDIAPMPSVSGERYAKVEEQAFLLTATAPVSTFGVDVDTGSYTNVRRLLTAGQMPPQDAIRVEEMLNYFHYDYQTPTSKDQPFAVTADVSRTPWNKDSYLLRVALKGYDVPRSQRPPANLVFLIDVSGSMMDDDKLPLLKTALRKLTRTLGDEDRVSIVTYAGWTGVALAPTRMTDRGKNIVNDVLDRLESGGSTAGSDGLALAYQQARKTMADGSINRVILATDGDFNVGTSDVDALKRMIESEREDGIALSTLGFGTGNYREDIMEMLADSGNGHYAYIDSADEATKVLVNEATSSLMTIAKDVKLQIEFNPKVVQSYRLIGYENRALKREDFDNDRKDAGDIGAGHTVTALYELIPVGVADPKTASSRYATQSAKAPALNEELAFLRLRYKRPDEKQSQLIERPLPASLIATAQAPRGSFAFATAVAALGQRLRHSEHIGELDYNEIHQLALQGGNATPSEFLRMVKLAAKVDTGIAAPGTAPGM